MIIGDPTVATHGHEVAARAVLARPRIRCWWCCDVVPQSPLRNAQIRLDISRPISLDFARAKHDVQPLGHVALDVRDLARIPGELEHGRRFRAARELGVPGFVAPGTELGRLVDSDDEVGAATPASACEGRLIDDISTRAHGSDGCRMRLVECGGPFRQFDRDNAATLCAEVLEIPLFVEIPLFGDELCESFADVWLRPASLLRL